MEEILQPDIDSRNQLFKATPISKYLAMALFVALPFVGAWIGYTYTPEKLIIVDASAQQLTSEKVTNNGRSELSIIKNIHEKYGYGSGPSYVGLAGNNFWFTKPHQTEGCPVFSYIELSSGNEVETYLSGCPLIGISESYPFHVVLCASQLDSVGESLCVTNLLTLEEKKIQITKSASETIIKECYEATYDVDCRRDIQAWGGGLLARIYKSVPRGQYAVYQNTELLREEDINLFKEFGLE